MTAKSIETGTGQTEGEGEGTVDTGVSDLEGGETSNINQRGRETFSSILVNPLMI